jgi:pimeloyl-ACP methyl ester carboxylesterase
MFYRVSLEVSRDLTPTPSRVEIPADLPFKVDQVRFASEDGLQMAGWFIPSKNRATIILLHGSGGDRTGMIWHAKQLIQAGYGVLMYDERASGESGGTHRSYGWEDPRDVRGAIRFVREKYGTDTNRIGIAGCSMGAQIALQGAAYNSEIEAVWADGTGTVRAQDIPPQHNLLLQLVVIGNYMTDWAEGIKLGMSPPAPLIDIIGNIDPRPVELVGSGIRVPLIGSEGDFMLYYATYAGRNTEVWIISDAPHCGGPAVRPDEYAARMTNFFDTAFGIHR